MCDDNFSKLSSSRSKRCCSCKILINPGKTCIELSRFRWPKSEIEIKIFGEGSELKIASWYLCEQCGEHFLNLTSIGFCYRAGENIMEMLKEYQEMTGFINNQKQRKTK